MARINVTQAFMPPIEEYQAYLQRIWDTNLLTNQGPLLQEFETEANKYLGTDNLQFVGNGTIALQLALSALDIKEGEIITTPFTYVATTSAILWERCKPVYVDIDPETLCIDANKIEAAITSNTKAILAVHVFGFPCEIEKIETIAEKHNLKVIYDAAHGFGVRHKGQAIFSYGDISTASFHATKLFHTIEGGAVFAKDSLVAKRIELMKKFGHIGDEHFALGINAKANEFQAAMGLCNLKYIDEIISKRQKLSSIYDNLLPGTVKRFVSKAERHNYGYYPVLLKDELTLNRILTKLRKQDIFPRRYFYPALHKLPYIGSSVDCVVTEDIVSRILCLPLHPNLEEAIIIKTCEALK